MSLYPLLSTICFALAAPLLARPLLALWDAVAGAQVADIRTLLRQLHVSTHHLQRYLRLWGVCLLAVFIVLGPLLRIWPFMVAMLFLVYQAPSLILTYQIRRRRTLLRDQLVTVISSMSNSIKAGLTLDDALEIAARKAEEPLAIEFRQIIDDRENNLSLEDSLTRIKNRLNLPSFSLFAIALIVNKDKGGKLGPSLDRLFHSLQENQRLERKLEADTATGQMVINILTAFPAVFLVLSFLMNRTGTMLMFSTFLGQMILAASIFIVYIGYRIGQRIVRIDF